MAEAVEHEGAGETRTWRVTGMDCASCVAKVEKAVSRLPGVQDIQVNLMAETLTARGCSRKRRCVRGACSWCFGLPGNASACAAQGCSAGCQRR